MATPTGLDFSHAAELYGLHHEPVEDLDGLRAALERALRARHASIVEVRTARAGNVGLHRRIWEASARALSPQAAGAGPASLISVSASSRAGSESRTIPLPA